jgi:glucokinase
VIVEARAGGERATKALRHAGTMLGVAVANVALVIGPQRVVAGGGVASAGEFLLGPARAELARRNRMMPPDRIEIVPAELGPQAGAIGAALWGCLAGPP